MLLVINFAWILFIRSQLITVINVVYMNCVYVELIDDFMVDIVYISFYEFSTSFTLVPRRTT